MAIRCPKCNAEVPEGAQFCGACGTPIAVAAAAGPMGAAAPAYTPVATVPPGTPVVIATAPAKSGSSAVKVALIVVAVIVCLGVLAAGAFGFFVWRVAHAVKVAGANGAVTIHTPGGTISTTGAKAFTSDELGTDIYPGAQATEGGMRMDTPTGAVITGVFLTGDSKDSVVSFYKNKLGSDTSVFDSGSGAVLSAKKSDKESLMVTVSSNKNEDEGKTKIVIVHSTSKGA